MVDTGAQRMMVLVHVTMSVGTTMAPSGETTNGNVTMTEMIIALTMIGTRYRRREYGRDDDREYQYGRS